MCSLTTNWIFRRSYPGLRRTEEWTLQRPNVVAQQEGKRDTWRQRLVELRPVVSYSTFAYLCEFYSDTESESLATLQILLKKLLSIGGCEMLEINDEVTDGCHATFIFFAVKVSPKRSIFIKTNGIVFE